MIVLVIFLLVISLILLLVVIILIKEGCSNNILIKWEIKEFDRKVNDLKKE
jgi:hypothetical protein